MSDWTTSDERYEFEFVALMLSLEEEALLEHEEQLRRLEEVQQVEKTKFDQLASEYVRERGLLQTAMKRRAGVISLTRRQLSDSRIRMQRSLHALYKDLRQIPRVREVYVRGPSLHVITDVLYGRDMLGWSYGVTEAQRKWRRVGAYRISMPLPLPDICYIRWENMGGLVEFDYRGGVKMWNGPNNINDKGTVSCFGTAKAPLERARRDRDWLTLVKIAVRYPECPGEMNAIRHWPAVDVSDVPEWYKSADFEHFEEVYPEIPTYDPYTGCDYE